MSTKLKSNSDPKDVRTRIHQSIPYWLDPWLWLGYGCVLLLLLPVLLGYISLRLIVLGIMKLLRVKHVAGSSISELWSQFGHGMKRSCCVCGCPAVITLETHYQKNRHFCKDCKPI